MSSNRYSKEELAEAVSTSTSIRQVLGKLGLKEAGGKKPYDCSLKNTSLIHLILLGNCGVRENNYRLRDQ